MLKSQILEKLHKKHNNLSFQDIDYLFDIFIKKISNCEKTKLIAFILPKSFKKESMQKCFNLYFSLDDEFDLPNNSFTINNKIHDVPCIFQVWIRRDKKRYVKPTQKPKSFTYVKKHETPQFSLRRVGVYAGLLSEETQKIPKPMVKIGNKPILVHIMNMYSKHGYRDFILALGYKQNIIKSYFKKNKYHN